MYTWTAFQYQEFAPVIADSEGGFENLLKRLKLGGFAKSFHDIENLATENLATLCLLYRCAKIQVTPCNRYNVGIFTLNMDLLLVRNTVFQNIFRVSYGNLGKAVITERLFNLVITRCVFTKKIESMAKNERERQAVVEIKDFLRQKPCRLYAAL